jgi:hypothetical protein
MAKELRFEQRVGDRRAIDFDERPVVLSAETVNGARDQLFATSGLAGNQYRASARRNELDLPNDLVDGAAPADDAVPAAMERRQARTGRDTGAQELHRVTSTDTCVVISSAFIVAASPAAWW